MSQKKKKRDKKIPRPPPKQKVEAEVQPLTPEMGGGCLPPMLAFGLSIVVFVLAILPAVQWLDVADKWRALLALAGWAAAFFLTLPLFVRWAAVRATKREE